MSIFSDNKSALINSSYPLGCGSGPLALAKSSDCTLGTSVLFYWTPGHRGLESNEKADTLAKEAAQSSLESETRAWVSLPASLSSLKQQCKRKIQEEDELNWMSKEEKSRFSFRKDKTAFFKVLDGFERGSASTIHQLRANHALLRNFLFQIETVPDQRCPSSGVWETAPHFLMFCSRYWLLRRTLKRKLRRLKCGINTDSF